MPYPTFNALRAFTANQARELEQFVSYLFGFLSFQHKDDGSHSAVTADSVTTPTATITDLTATDATVRDLTVTEQVTIDGPVTIAPTTTATPLTITPASGASVIAAIGGQATEIDFYNMQTSGPGTARARLFKLAWTASGAGATATWTFDQPTGTSIEEGAVQWVASAGTVMGTVSKTGFSTAQTMAAAVFQTTTALVATGGGGSTAAFTANSVGGTGQPTTAAQNGWVQMQDSTGATVWIPVWK